MQVSEVNASSGLVAGDEPRGLTDAAGVDGGMSPGSSDGSSESKSPTASSSSVVERARSRVPSWSRRRWAVTLLGALLVGVVLAAAGFYAYFGVLGFHAPADVASSVRENPNVTVERAYGGYVLGPTTALPDETRAAGDGVGVVFYPGGRVAPDAYLPSAARVVEETGATVVVPKMTANLAVLSQGKASAVIDGENGVETWIVGGHSLGGAMACRYANATPERVDGLVLVGAYCDRAVTDVPALSAVGTRDAVLDRERFRATRGNLPADATVVRIDGMNHSQAGWYYGQAGGQPATISYETAHHRLAAAVEAWLCNEYDRCSDGSANASARIPASPRPSAGIASPPAAIPPPSAASEVDEPPNEGVSAGASDLMEPVNVRSMRTFPLGS